jgi:hypothetical protein
MVREERTGPLAALATYDVVWLGLTLRHVVCRGSSAPQELTVKRCAFAADTHSVARWPRAIAVGSNDSSTMCGVPA